VAVVPATSGAALAPSYVHDVKVFHQVAGQRSQPQPAEIALLVGGQGIGKLVPGINRRGKQFVIADVRGARVVSVMRTGSNARISLSVTDMCRRNPQARYWIRAEATINGRLRKGFTRGDCGWVVQVLNHDSQATTHTTFVFEN
jgi:hypothetical protein